MQRKDCAVTDKGVCSLARAIDAADKRRLPMLSEFETSYSRGTTPVGTGALAFALIKNCPRLMGLKFYSFDGRR